MMDKVIDSAAEAVADVVDGSSIAVGGFGVCGIPSTLINALFDSGTSQLQVVSNNAGIDDWGLGVLLAAGRLKRIIASYVGENKEFARQYLGGALEVELTPQGTLAGRLRAGGAGILAFFTETGVGTQIADGGLPWRYNADGSVAIASAPKTTAKFSIFGHQRTYVMEEAIVTDFALVRAAVGDRYGNLVFAASAQNFNPLAAMAGRITIAEVEELVEPGDIPPAAVHLPSVYVHRVVPLSATDAADKRIEKLTVRLREVS